MELNRYIRTATRAPSGGFTRDALAAQRSRPLRWLVRAGFVARGVTYGVIGAISVALALGLGSQTGNPNQQGALVLIASAPLGRVLLVLLALGSLAYALWKLGRGVLGTGPEGGAGPGLKDRAANFGGGVVYLGFSAVAVRVLIGSAGNQAAEQRSAAAGVLGWPGGAFLVAAAGTGLIAVSAYQAYAALRGDFARENKIAQMSSDQRRLFLAIGRTGLTARAIVFALVGYFLVRTALDFRAEGGLGVDGALAEVHGRPFGPWLLAIVAIGLLVFAAFSFLEARYQRL